MSATILSDKVCVITGGRGGIGTASVGRVRARGNARGSASTSRRSAGTAVPCACRLDRRAHDDISALRARAPKNSCHRVLFNNAAISPGRRSDARPRRSLAGPRAVRLTLRAYFPSCAASTAIRQPASRRAADRVRQHRPRFVAFVGARHLAISYTPPPSGVSRSLRELAGFRFVPAHFPRQRLCPGPVDTPLLQELYRRTPIRPRAGWFPVPSGSSRAPRRSQRRLCSLRR